MTSSVEITLPSLKGPAANQALEKLLSALRRDRDLKTALDTARTGIRRTDEEAQDFGATLIAVLGTPAVVYLAIALKNWATRTGTSVVANGIEIKNVRSEDLGKIVESLKGSAPKKVSAGKPASASPKKSPEKKPVRTSKSPPPDEKPAPRKRTGAARGKSAT
jgi:hypothetical protein